MIEYSQAIHLNFQDLLDCLNLTLPSTAFQLPCAFLESHRFLLDLKFWGEFFDAPAPALFLHRSITFSCSTSASSYFPWSKYVLARFSIMTNVSGCSGPSSILLRSRTFSSSYSASSFFPCFEYDTARFAMAFNVSGCSGPQHHFTQMQNIFLKLPSLFIFSLV